MISCQLVKLLIRQSHFPARNLLTSFRLAVVSRKPQHCTSVACRIYTSSHLNQSDDLESFDYESSYATIDYDAITNGDQESLKMLKILQLEVDVLAQQGDKVPKSISTDQWRELLLCPSKAQRTRYLSFLWLNQMKKETRKRKVAERQVYFQQVLEERKKARITGLTTSSPMEYGLSRNSLFHRIYDTQINTFLNYRLLKKMMLGPDIIMDCSYDSFMSRKETANCARQLLFVFSENREHFNPFNVIFCGTNPDTYMLQRMKKTLPQLFDDHFPFNWTSKHYLDLYPKEQLVYLTPHCNEELTSYDHNKVYIVGAMVDRSSSEPLSLAKAKKDGIAMAKFPLDRYLKWGLGIKSLTLNQCVSIMLDLKDGHGWEYSLRHVPRRKLMNDPMDDYVNEKRSNKITAKSIRESYRRNLVYDLLLKERLNKT